MSQNHNASDDNIRYRQWNQNSPTQMHQLVITESRNRPTHPHIEKYKSTDFNKQHDNSNYIRQVYTPIFNSPRHSRIVVTSEKQDR